MTLPDILELNPELQGNTTPENTTVRLPCQSERERRRAKQAAGRARATHSSVRPPASGPGPHSAPPLRCACLAGPVTRGATVLDLLRGRPDMSILVRVVEAANLTEMLSGACQWRQRGVRRFISSVKAAFLVARSGPALPCRGWALPPHTASPLALPRPPPCCPGPAPTPPALLTPLLPPSRRPWVWRHTAGSFQLLLEAPAGGFRRL